MNKIASYIAKVLKFTGGGELQHLLRDIINDKYVGPHY